MPITLKDIELALNANDCEAHLSRVSDDLPIEQVLAHLGQDDQNRDLFAQVLFIGDLAAWQAAENGAELPDADDLLQLYSAFPFTSRPEAFPDLARLILMLNHDLPVSFGLGENDGSVFCRHVVLCPEREMNVQAVVEAVELMGVFMGAYGEALEAIARGDKTLAQVVSEINESVETDD
jgi:hypothetical protein